MAVVGVVTPVYNGERYLRGCIESVLNQTFEDWQYVIVDNCSSDSSRSIAESYSRDKRIRIYHNEKVLPVTASFNRAASLVPPEAKYLKFICADDFLFNHCLEMMVEVAESNPGVKLVGSYKIHGKYPVCEGPPFPDVVMSGKEACKWFFQGKLGILGSETNHLIKLPAPTVGGNLYDAAFAKHSDTELFVRMLKDGGNLGFVHQVLTFTREHEGSVSATDAHVLGTGGLETLAMLLKHGPSFLSEDELRELVRIHKRKYSQFVFRSLLKPWDRRALKYHAANWSKLGISMNFPELVKTVLRGASMSAVHPVDSYRRIRSAYLRRVS